MKQTDVNYWQCSSSAYAPVITSTTGQGTAAINTVSPGGTYTDTGFQVSLMLCLIFFFFLIYLFQFAISNTFTAPCSCSSFNVYVYNVDTSYSLSSTLNFACTNNYGSYGTSGYYFTDSLALNVGNWKVMVGMLNSR